MDFFPSELPDSGLSTLSQNSNNPDIPIAIQVIRELLPNATLHLEIRMNSELLLISPQDSCINFFREISATYKRFIETEAGSAAESSERQNLGLLHAKVASIFELYPTKIEQVLPTGAPIYDAAIVHPDAQVRMGLSIYMDGILGFRCDLAEPSPYKVTFGLLCYGSFPGVSGLGAVDDTGDLAPWIAKRLMLPESQLQVHRVPVRPDLCFAGQVELTYSVLCAKVNDADALAEAAWQTASQANDNDSESVVFWVTATLDSKEQLLRVTHLISEGATTPAKPALSRIPFTVEGSIREAMICPLEFNWPHSVLVNSVFMDLGIALVDAIKGVQQRGIPLSEVVAELRRSAEDPAHPVRFYIELSDYENGVVLARVPGLPAIWLNCYISEFQEAVAENKLQNACWRTSPQGPLRYFFEALKPS